LNGLQVFDFEENAVRMMVLDGEPWWVANDVCRVVGLSNVSQAVSRLDDDQKDNRILNDVVGREKRMVIVNETGLYELVFRSDKPEAKRFRKWVTKEVLPTIRKVGSFDEGLAKYADNPEYLALLADDRDVRAAEKFLQLTRDQKIQEYKIDAIKAEQASIVKNLREVDERSLVALTTASAAEKTANGYTGYFATMGYANKLRLNISQPQQSVLGRMMSKYCRENDIHFHEKTLDHSKFGSHNAYPVEVLEKFKPEFISRSSTRNGEKSGIKPHWKQSNRTNRMM
jgi:prophage antirepressor-like protein